MPSCPTRCGLTVGDSTHQRFECASPPTPVLWGQRKGKPLASRAAWLVRSHGAHSKNRIVESRVSKSYLLCWAIRIQVNPAIFGLSHRILFVT